MVPREHASPAGKASRGLEGTHVAADLRDQALGYGVVTPGMVPKSSTSAPQGVIDRSTSSESVPMASSKKSNLARIEQR